MKTRNLIAHLLITLFMGLNIHSFAQESPVDPFLGMWALTLDYDNNHAGWLEVRQEQDYLDSEMLWRWGSVTPVDFTLLNEGTILLVNGRDVVREKDTQGNPVRTTHPVTWFQIAKAGEGQLEGMAFFPNPDGVGVEAVSFTGKRIPAYGEAPRLKKNQFGEPIKLFNGKDLQGWELLDKNATNGWKVVDGVLINDPVQKEGEKHISYGNLRTADTYEGSDRRSNNFG